MNVAAGPELAAAVSNAGGLGVIGGLGYTYVALIDSVVVSELTLVDPNISEASSRISNPH